MRIMKLPEEYIYESMDTELQQSLIFLRHNVKTACMSDVIENAFMAQVMGPCNNYKVEEYTLGALDH